MMKFASVVLAADREKNNPVAQAAGVPCKTLALLNDQPMLTRVLAALSHCSRVERIVLCGPTKEIWQTCHEEIPHAKPLDWIPPASSPSLSAWQGVNQIEKRMPVLLTTADLAFPSARIFTHFCQQAAHCGMDVAVGLVPYQDVVTHYPGVDRTPLKFSDGPFCTCNLFAFLTPAGRNLIKLWRQLEQDRKRPWRLIRALGFTSLLQYLSGRLSTDEVAKRVHKTLGIRVAFISLPYPTAAIDVDTQEDLEFVRHLLDLTD